jgi:hypothetical protein
MRADRDCSKEKGSIKTEPKKVSPNGSGLSLLGSQGLKFFFQAIYMKFI